MNPKEIYVEFIGNKYQCDKENYKRYCGVEKFDPLSTNDKVVRFIEYSAYESAIAALIQYTGKSKEWVLEKE